MSKWTRHTIVFSQKELLNVKHGSLTYYMACVLKGLGAPINFNKVNVYLKPEEIEICGYVRDRIKMDGSHEFVFEELKEVKNENEQKQDYKMFRDYK